MAMVCISGGGSSVRTNTTAKPNSPTSAKSGNAANTVKPSTVTKSISDAKSRVSGAVSPNTYTPPENKIYSNKDKHTTTVTTKSGGTLQATGLYADISKPVADKSGLYTGTQSVGIAEFKGHNKSNTFEWQFNSVSASLKGGVGTRYTGFDGTASLFSGNVGGVLFDKVYVGIAGYAGGVSGTTPTVYENGKITRNYSLPYGFGISVTYGFVK